MLLPSNNPVNQPPFALHIGCYAPLLGLLIALYAAPLHAESLALRSARGILFVQIWPEGGCTVEAPAKKVRALQNQPGVYWLDDQLLQVTLVPIANFCAASTCADTTATGLLKTHRNWELAHWRQSLGTPTLSLADSGLVSLAETQWLFWSFAMPQSESADNVKKQLMLSTRVGEHVLNLGVPLWQHGTEQQMKTYLESVAATLAILHEPVDIAAVQNTLRGPAPYVAAPAQPATGAVSRIEECGLEFQLPSAQWTFRERQTRGPLVMHLYERKSLTDARDRTMINVTCEKTRPEWDIATYSAMLRKRNGASGIIERILTRKDGGLAPENAIAYRVRWVDNAANQHTSYIVHMLSGGTGMQFVADTTTELYETLRPEWDAALRTLVVTGSAR